MTYVAAASLNYNGLAVAISGAPAAGDVFNVQNTVSSAATANTGSGAIGVPTVNGVGPDLLDPVTITFNAPPGTFNVTGTSTGSPTATVAYPAGAPISFNGWTAVLIGTPAAGDTFTIGTNSAGVGDNQNGLRLADLQTTSTLIGGTASYGEAYGQLVARIGTLTRQANIDSQAQTALLNQSLATRESISGVNLDEEAANLLRFQQAYQASAQIIATADTLFESLLRAVGR